MTDVTDQEVIQRIVESEQGRQAANAILRDQTAARIDLKANIEKLKRERGEAKSALTDDVEAARQQLEAARAALTEAETEYLQAAARQAQTVAGYSGRIQALQNKLKAAAPSAIDDFLTWLDDERTALSGAGVQHRARQIDLIQPAGGLKREHWSTAKSMAARMTAIQEARQEAESLRSMVLDSDDLTSRLEALRESLPVIVMQADFVR